MCALFGLIDYRGSLNAVRLIKQQKEVSFDSLRSMAEAVRGHFTFTILTQDNSLYFVKGENPLTLLHYPALGLYLYASTEGILLTALKTLGMSRLKSEIIQPESGEILRIDRFGISVGPPPSTWMI